MWYNPPMTEAITVTEEKTKLGRPAMYETPEEMEIKLNAFFIECKANEDPPTVLGLSLFLGFADPHTLLVYSKLKPFSWIVKKAKSKCVHDIEKRMITGKTPPASAMYWLSNNSDWKNERYQRTDIHHSGNIDVTLLPGGTKRNYKDKKVIDV